MLYSTNTRRFWLPRGTRPLMEGGSNGGFLLDPEQTLSFKMSGSRGEERTLNDLSSVRCLFLLGEMGMGKSEELHAQVTQLQQILPPEELLHFDLGCRSESRLESKVFNSEIVQAWRQSEGNQQLHLFLDAYDEGLLGIPYLGKLLQDEMRSWPYERLFLRITCRPAQWPTSLESFCKQLWQGVPSEPQNEKRIEVTNSEKVQTYHLAPLRRTDVRHLAEHHPDWGVSDPDSFMHAVSARNVEAFAAKPLTLKFLLQQFRGNPHKTLPGTRTELWKLGCLELCKERNDDRLDSVESLRFQAPELLAVATRIAGVTLLSKRSALWLGPHADEAGEDEVSPSQLIGGDERFEWSDESECKISVTRDIVIETAGTGLFAGFSAGPRRVTWQHRGYEEFLAARYLIVREVPLPRLITLLCHEGKEVFPPVREVAATLATLHPEFFNHLLNHDVDTLLASDVAATGNEERKRIGAALLRCLSDGQIRAQDLFGRTRALHNPALSGQILSCLSDKSQPENVRLGAVFMSQGCFVTEKEMGMEEDIEYQLVQITLDKKESDDMRTYAAIALLHTGGEEARKQLLPLTRRSRSRKQGKTKLRKANNPSRHLKGVALEAVWPRHLSAEQLFKSLDSSSDSGHSTYETFLSFHLVPGLAPTDFPVALAWVAQQDRATRHESNFYIKKLTDEIVASAWEHMDVPGVADALAAVALKRATEHGELAGAEVVNKDGKSVDAYSAF